MEMEKKRKTGTVRLPPVFKKTEPPSRPQGPMPEMKGGDYFKRQDRGTDTRYNDKP